MAAAGVRARGVTPEDEPASPVLRLSGFKTATGPPSAPGGGQTP
ncbi:hypothetical protein STTU_5010 [Streptomyces sp. Tu6071]|nr:hypothetical protein STTU_5010 [Streptomyces sp. Tu6071]